MIALVGVHTVRLSGPKAPLVEDSSGCLLEFVLGTVLIMFQQMSPVGLLQLCIGSWPSIVVGVAIGFFPSVFVKLNMSRKTGVFVHGSDPKYRNLPLCNCTQPIIFMGRRYVRESFVLNREEGDINFRVMIRP